MKNGCTVVGDAHLKQKDAIKIIICIYIYVMLYGVYIYMTSVYNDTYLHTHRYTSNYIQVYST